AAWAWPQPAMPPDAWGRVIGRRPRHGKGPHPDQAVDQYRQLGGAVVRSRPSLRSSPCLDGLLDSLRMQLLDRPPVATEVRLGMALGGRDRAPRPGRRTGLVGGDDDLLAWGLKDKVNALRRQLGARERRGRFHRGPHSPAPRRTTSPAGLPR